MEPAVIEKSPEATNGVKTRTIKLKVFQAQRFELLLTGEEPGLLASRISPEMLENPPTKAERKAADFKDKVFQQARYLLPDGTDAFPAAAVKQAIAQAGSLYSERNKVLTYGQIRIPADLLPLDIPDVPVARDDVAVNKMLKRRAAIVTTRPWYKEWKIVVPVIFWSDSLELETVYNLFRIAGQAVGLGAWRIEKGGNFGAFTVALHKQPAPYDRWEKRGKGQ